VGFTLKKKKKLKNATPWGLKKKKKKKKKELPGNQTATELWSREYRANEEFQRGKESGRTGK
jgi:hypothetical protein